MLPNASRPTPSSSATTTPPSRTDARPAIVAVLLCAALVTAACGKRGSPLAPIVRIPAAVAMLTAARLGSDIYITVTVPDENIDASFPADISRIDIYAYTGRRPPPVTRFAEVATVVASIPVAPPPDPLLPVPTPPFGFVDPMGAWQGTMTTVRDTLDADEMVQGPDLAVEPRGGRAPVMTPVVVPQPLGALRRFYVAIPWSRRERPRPGPPSTIVDVPLIDLPERPTGVRAAYTDTAVQLTWEPSGGLLGFIMDRPLPPESAPFDAPVLMAAPLVPPPPDPVVPAGPTTYNVFIESAPDPLLLPGTEVPEWSAPPPVAVGVGPALAWTGPVEFGRPLCFTVRAVRGTAPPVASEPSPPTCMVAVDVFPPAAPTGLAAVPSEGAVNLIWEPNAELDLGGYLVLRREGSDATLRQLTATPIGDARFRDTDVKPGMRYVYSVVAVDAQLPLPNMSAESERVEEIAR